MPDAVAQSVMDRRTERLELRSRSEADTASIGEIIGRRIAGRLCVCLVGSLGSGKSVLARAICRGLGVGEDVVSPTFILCEEYAGRLPVIHSDLYRLEHEREIEELGLFERLGDEVVVLVEWGERSPRLMGSAEVVIEIAMAGSAERSIEIRCTRERRPLFEGIREEIGA